MQATAAEAKEGVRSARESPTLLLYSPLGPLHPLRFTCKSAGAALSFGLMYAISAIS